MCEWSEMIIGVNVLKKIDLKSDYSINQLIGLRIYKRSCPSLRGSMNIIDLPTWQTTYVFERFVHKMAALGNKWTVGAEHCFYDWRKLEEFLKG